jgi:hypothetical protein
MTYDEVVIAIRAMQTMYLSNGYYTPLSGEKCMGILIQLQECMEDIYRVNQYDPDLLDDLIAFDR